MFSPETTIIRRALRHVLIWAALLILSASVALAAPAGTVVGLSGASSVTGASPARP